MSQVPQQPAVVRQAGPHYQPLVVVVVAVCVGIVVDRWCGWPMAVWWSAALAASIAWVFAWRREYHRTSGLILLFALAASAAAWHHCRWSLFGSDDIGRFAIRKPRPICAKVVARKGPVRLPAPNFDPMRVIPVGDRTRLDVEVIELRDSDRWRRASGRATLIVDGHLLGVHAGDQLEVFGQLAAVRWPQNPGEADRAAYARASRVGGILRSAYPDCVTVLQRPFPGSFGRWVERLRSSGDRLLSRYIHPRRSALGAALLLGLREELGDERSDVFLETGTIHLLAISGLHVGIVASAMFLALRMTLVPRSVTALTVAGLVLCYALLTDARPPAVRATVLVLVICVAHGLQLRRLAFNSLAAAALVVLAMNPAELFNIGAQLSFLSVVGLMWFAPQWMGAGSEADPLERLVSESRGWPARLAESCLRWLRDLTLASGTIWLLTSPLAAAQFHVVAPIGLVLNTIVWLPVALGLVFGFLVLATGWLLPPVAAVFGWCCNACLGLAEVCIHVAHGIPFSRFWVPGPAEWWLLGLYGGLGLFAAFPVIRPSRRWFVGIMACWTALGFAVSLAAKERRALECTFLSVGHGCAVVIRLPSGRTMLYDAGQLGSPELGARAIAGCLWSYGATHVDAIALSHSDADHCNAVPELLNMCSAGVVYVSPVMFETENVLLGALQDGIRGRNVPIREISAGNRLEAGEGCRVEVLHPTRRGVVGSDNANSIVLAIEYLGRRILLPGDLESPGLDDLLAEMPWHCDVLLAPHHGSRKSDPPGLAAWCRPRWVVISGGYSPDSDETAAAYRAAGAEVFHTADCGAVRVRIDPAGIKFVGWGRPWGRNALAP